MSRPVRRLHVDPPRERAVLAARHRVTDAATFRAVTRRGRRGSTRTLVAHVVTPPAGDDGPARVGFIVGKTVGNSVVRHRVQRRLRHQVASRMAGLEPGSQIVVRALPAAAGADSAELGRDLDRALTAAGGDRRSR